jgi:hypothetical protein
MIGKRDSQEVTEIPVLASTHVFNANLDLEVEHSLDAPLILVPLTLSVQAAHG